MTEEDKARFEARRDALISAVVEKAERECLCSLALVGVCGSALTGDIHERSDLDLLILINDDGGRKLSAAFILGGEGREVGYDLYCTTWGDLERDAGYSSPHIAKLMDSKIVWCADEKYLSRLSVLRERARANISDAGRARAGAYRELADALAEYARLTLSTGAEERRLHLAGMLYNIENAVCMLNQTYFRLGVRRLFDELDGMAKKPETLLRDIKYAVEAVTAEELAERAALLMSNVREYFERLPGADRPLPDAAALRGSWEEIFSNWRNKMYVAAANGDVHLSLMTAASARLMLRELAEEYELPEYRPLERFGPRDLAANAAAFDGVLREYAREYEKVGLAVVRYVTEADFLRAYLGE